MAVAILVLAAGASSRMRGEDKLLLPVEGQPLLARTVGRAVETGLKVTVALPPDRPGRAAAIAGQPVATVTVADAHEGQSRSLRAGLAALPADCTGAIILMADMPEIEATDLLALADRFAALGGDTPCRAAAQDGTPGGPALVPRRLFPALMALTGDKGGREVLKSEPQEIVALPGRRALTDLDTPEDWAAWRAGKG